jgi:thymidylate kinase
MTSAGDGFDDLLADFDRDLRSRNGLPDAATRADRRRCLDVVQAVLADTVTQDGVIPSVLGVEWTEVFDVPVVSVPDEARLLAAGWLPMDRLLDPRAATAGTSRRWAVVDDGRVLAGVQFVDSRPDPVQATLARCAERAEVRLRDVLELRELRRRQSPFPPGGDTLRAAAEIESGLGGRLLAPWASGRSAWPPVAVRPRPRGLVIAISGVDGSGKSTLRASLTQNLSRAGVPVDTVWVRPGMGLGRLIALATWGKRLLRQDVAPGLRAMADPTAPRPVSRKGAVGWLWALLVTLSFLLGVWRQHRAARGVVVYDRHLLDALATLDFAYAGVDLRVQHRLVRALLPRADVRLYLDVPADVSVARKPDDLLGEHAIRRQLAEYERWLARLPEAVRLDATQPGDALVAQALRLVSMGRHDGHDGRIRR